MEEDNEESKFSEEDIDTILQRRTQTIKLEVIFIIVVKFSYFKRIIYAAKFLFEGIRLLITYSRNFCIAEGIHCRKNFYVFQFFY